MFFICLVLLLLFCCQCVFVYMVLFVLFRVSVGLSAHVCWKRFVFEAGSKP